MSAKKRKKKAVKRADRRAELKLYRQGDSLLDRRDWYWNLKDLDNGKTLGASSEGFANRGHAVDNILRGAGYSVSPVGRAPSYRWIVSDDRTVAPVPAVA